MGSVDGLPAQHQPEQSLSSKVKLHCSFIKCCLRSSIKSVCVLHLYTHSQRGHTAPIHHVKPVHRSEVKILLILMYLIHILIIQCTYYQCSCRLCHYQTLVKHCCLWKGPNPAFLMRGNNDIMGRQEASTTKAWQSTATTSRVVFVGRI